MSTDGVSIGACTSAEDVEAIRALLERYWASFGFAPDFQNFEDELRTLPGRYAPPGGMLLLARVGTSPAGCIALRRLAVDTAEAKRLFVLPERRGSGDGAALLRELIRRAAAVIYRSLVADTLPRM